MMKVHLWLVYQVHYDNNPRDRKKRQRVKNSFDPFEHFMYFESSSYVSSSEDNFTILLGLKQIHHHHIH